LNILQDLRERFVERYPNISKYPRWGPGYFVWIAKDDEAAPGHGFGGELYKQTSAQSRLGCSLDFSNDTRGEIYCTAYVEGAKVKAREETKRGPATRRECVTAPT